MLLFCLTNLSLTKHFIALRAFDRAEGGRRTSHSDSKAVLVGCVDQHSVSAPPHLTHVCVYLFPAYFPRTMQTFCFCLRSIVLPQLTADWRLITSSINKTNTTLLHSILLIKKIFKQRETY